MIEIAYHSIANHANHAAPIFRHFFPTKKSDDMKILEAYISQPSGDLSDLKGFPIIHKLFRKYNTLMPSSASVEVC